MGTTETLNSLSFQLTFGIVGMILLTAFIVVFFIVYQRRLLQQQLSTQQMEADYQKELLHAGILAQEAERERIATELHDSIGGLLSATKIYLANVNQEQPANQFQLFKEKALQALNENIGEVRTITNDLLPQSLERLGIVPATRNLTEKLKELKNIRVDFTANSEQRFEQNREKALFRVLQELINNTLKHSNTERIRIDFEFTPEDLSILYLDEGEGFDLEIYENRKDRQSFGLKNMQSRIAFLNGKIDYQTAPGQGVTVQLQVPLPKPGLITNDYEYHHSSSLSG